jgi:hypothetical protein
MRLFSLAFTFLVSAIALADPQASGVITQKNSNCSVVSSAGEYPAYRVMRGKKELFAPRSDGIARALISPSGKYVALSAGETDLIDVKPGRMEYGVAVVNCKSGKVAGYLKGKPALILKWNGDFELVSDSGELRFGKNGSSNLP